MEAFLECRYIAARPGGYFDSVKRQWHDSAAERNHELMMAARYGKTSVRTAFWLLAAPKLSEKQASAWNALRRCPLRKLINAAVASIGGIAGPNSDDTVVRMKTASMRPENSRLRYPR